MTDEYRDENIITLTDEDGKECNFEVMAEKEIEGITYYALLPLEDNENGEYVLLKLEKDEDGEDILVSVDDDDEFDRVSDIFEDEFFSDIDYDDNSDR